eukprot:TRINITY_DN9143_c0_g1_i1.p1 TRINITY_DN9143_c0_g1~~TRINITY_DN9143_c0_g1_i1.p1  ORF type:complete len:217 (-),score=21.26 TRINITY_DN9143_c0_g1_i1:257-907(-)
MCVRRQRSRSTCCRRLTSHLGRPFRWFVARTASTSQGEPTQRHAPDAALIGSQRAHAGVDTLAALRVVLELDDSNDTDDVDIELPSWSSEASASSMGVDDPFVASRRRAKEALLALLVLSRSAWGPDGRSLPLHLYAGVADCLGRRHSQQQWQDEEARMRELMKTLDHDEMVALLDAIARGEDGDVQDETMSAGSYASSQGSLTRLWKGLFRWFSL